MVAPCQAHASELEGIYEKSGAGELYGALDQETQDLLDQAGVEEGVWEGQTGENLLKLISQLLRERLTAPLKGLASLLGIVILCRLAGNFEEGGSASVLAGTLACAGVLTAPLLELIRSAEQVIENACVFLGASVLCIRLCCWPLAALSWEAHTAFLTLAAGNLISLLSQGVLMPLLHIFLTLALATSLCGGRFDGPAEKPVRIGEVAAGFGGYGVLWNSLSADRAQLPGGRSHGKGGEIYRLLRHSIVGSAFGDAVSAIQNSVRVVKSGVGAFGILAALCILAPLWCRQPCGPVCVCWARCGRPV